MLCQFSIFPLGKEKGLHEEVAHIVKIIEDSGLSFKFGPMSTVVEGEWQDIMSVINKCREYLHQKYDRIYINISIDDRKNAVNRINGKVKEVLEFKERNLS